MRRLPPFPVPAQEHVAPAAEDQDGSGGDEPRQYGLQQVHADVQQPGRDAEAEAEIKGPRKKASLVEHGGLHQQRPGV